MTHRRKGIRAVFMRGGTSKALVFRAHDLPTDPAERDAFFLSVMGSPDPGRRQLDGMGGGVSSLSKICIVDPSERPDADVDYTFVQVPVAGTRCDTSANCGNMSSAIGPFAVEEGLVRPDGATATVRIFNTNTNKIIVSRFPLVDGLPAERGDCAIPGVAGTGAPIRLEFLDPGGATSGRLLPTGSPVDLLGAPGEEVPVSVVDATNCCAYVPASALGLTGIETPEALEADAALMERLERLRRLAAVAAGLAADEESAAVVEANPKIAVVAPPQDYRRSDGEAVAADAHDVAVRMLSMGQPHRAIPLTGALCTAAASRIPGTTVAEACRQPADGADPVRIGHAGGVLPALASVTVAPDGTVAVEHAGVFRTARRLMEGTVFG